MLWFLLIRLLSLSTILFTLYSITSGCVYVLSFPLFSSSSYPLCVSFLFDLFSLRFMRIVLIISTIIIIYSYNYISPYRKPYYFLWLTVLFVTSIILVIVIPNLFFAILGWDGLGLVSFFLIVYYQNQSSIVSGIFTLLINRLGDRFFLLRLALLFYEAMDYTYFSSLTPTLTCSVFLVLTFMTKRAIYPFSPWLPIAMAAPTPISALVHSSTLVTAGLYLIIRYSYFLYFYSRVMSCLFVAGLFTSFYAGFNSVLEIDFKKLIALSTLRHLGFIVIAFSAGLLHLRFFHLLVHALFKSLLFMCIGDIIINLRHSQDSRYLSSGFIYTPFSCFTISISLVNLLGLPSLRGFFTKDLILETLSFSNVSWVLEFILYFNVFFTYYYTYKLFYYSFSSNKLNPYQLFHSVSSHHFLTIAILSIFTMLFASFYISHTFSYFIFYPLLTSLKFLPLLLNSLIFLILLVLLVPSTRKTKFSSSFFSSMLFLSNLAITFSSNSHYNLIFISVKSSEFGLFNFRLNTQRLRSIKALNMLSVLSLLKVQRSTLFCSFLFFFVLFCSFLLC